MKIRSRISDEDWQKLGYTIEQRGEAGRILRPHSHSRRKFEPHGRPRLTPPRIPDKEQMLEFIRQMPSFALRSKVIIWLVRNLILSGDRKTLSQVVDAARNTTPAKRGRRPKADSLRVGSLHKVLSLALRAYRKGEIGDDGIIIGGFDFDPVKNETHREALRLARTGRPALGATKVVMQYFAIGLRTFKKLNSEYKKIDAWFKKQDEALEEEIRQEKLQQ